MKFRKKGKIVKGMRYKIRKIIVKFTRILKIDILLFHINKKKTYIEINETTLAAAEEDARCCSADPKTSCITNNNINSVYDLHIIIPAYNVEAYIEECLTSIFSIDMKYSYFVTVVNDGSKDRTGDILQRFACKDNILIINQENRGFSGARNAALKNIYGKYLMFVDSDDSIEPRNIEKMLKKAIDGDYDIVEGGFCTVSPKGKTISKSRGKTEDISKTVGNFRGQPWGKIFRAELFKNVCFPEKYWFEDTVLAQIIYPQVTKASRIGEVVYYYLINPKGITQTVRGKNKSIDSLYVVLGLFQDRKKLGLTITQDYYEHILRIIQLTFKRTNGLNDEVQKSIFLLWCDFIKKNFLNMNTEIKSKKELEKAIREKNFGYYCAACKYL